MKTMRKNRQAGMALLVVLLIVMAVTIVSLGFLSRSDVELACGENMVLRSQMDYLAESGLQHARGLILNPQDVGGEYWTGAVRQQLAPGGGDFYDVNVFKLSECNYQITCSAYRESVGEKVGCSNLEAELRLDRAIACWVGTSQNFGARVTIGGDVYCSGTLVSAGAISGDVFADGLSGSIGGQLRGAGDLALQWPRVTVADFTSRYAVQTVPSSLAGQTFGPYEPVRVCYRSGDLALNGSVRIEGMLVVGGNLTVKGSGNVITASKNLPAFLVTGDVIIEQSAVLEVQGLGVVDGRMLVSGAGTVNVLGALFVKNGIIETAVDSSGKGNVALVRNGASRQPAGGKVDGAFSFDGIDDFLQTEDDVNKLQLTSDYTFSVWIKADASQKLWAGIFSKCDSTGAVNHWTLQFDNITPKKLLVYHPSASWDTGIRLSQLGGAWHHVRIVRRAGVMTSYLDGNPAQSNTWNVNPGSGNGHLNIGVDRTGLATYVYKGLIDDIRIYDRAPDANSVYPTVDPIGYWKLDEAGAVVNITAAPLKTAVVVWSETGSPQNWCCAAGGWFRRLERK